VSARLEAVLREELELMGSLWAFQCVDWTAQEAMCGVYVGAKPLRDAVVPAMDIDMNESEAVRLFVADGVFRANDHVHPKAMWHFMAASLGVA
jgi:hypothetical protein